MKFYKALLQLPDGYWKTQKLKETKDLIAQCSGLFIDATQMNNMLCKQNLSGLIFLFNNRLGAGAILQRSEG